MKVSKRNGVIVGGDARFMEVFLRCIVLRYVCVVMECFGRLRKDDGVGEKGDNDRRKVFELVRGDIESFVVEVGGRR